MADREVPRAPESSPTDRETSRAGAETETGTDEGDRTAAFRLLASEVRLAIVEALGDAMAGGSHSPLPFSDIQERVGVEDNGRFNYHLRQLVGHFVESVEEGYRLRLPGVLVYQAVRSGAYVDSTAVDPQPAGDPCTNCDDELQIWYDGARFTVGCRDCEDTDIQYPLPGWDAEDDDADDLLSVANRRIHRDMTSMRQGICPYCSGRVDASLSDDREGLPSDAPEESVVHYTCRRCHWFMHTSPGGPASTHPAIVAFFYEHGYAFPDYRAWRPPGEFTHAVESREPLRISVTFEVEADARALVLDEEAEVVEVREDA